VALAAVPIKEHFHSWEGRANTMPSPFDSLLYALSIFKDYENIPDLGSQRPKTQRSKDGTSAEGTN